VNAAEYTPGDWYAVVAGGVVLLLAPTTPPEVVREVWASAPEHGALAGQLDALMRHGIGGLHPFAAVALSGDGVQTALRGDVEVEVVRGTRAEVLTAPEVVSWSERTIGAAEEVTVRVAGAPRGTSLPLVSGVVRASRVRVRVTADAAGPAAPAAGPVVRTVVEPVPAPEPEPLPAPEPVGEAAPAPAPVVAPEPAPAPVDRTPVAVPASVGAWGEPWASAPSPSPLDALDLPEAGLTLADLEPLEPAEPEPAPVAAEATVDPEPAPWTPEPALTLPGPASADDHDGLTILSGELASIRQNLPSWAVSQTGEWPSGPAPTPAPQPVGAPSFTGPLGAPAPASAPVPQVPAAAPAAPVVRMVLSTGAVVPLDRPVLLGRAPQAERAPAGARLLAVPSPEQDISRSHAQVQVEQGQVLVTDLYSTNGVTVASGALAPRRITAGEPVAVQAGDVVDLGDGVTFSVEPGA
jgi:resuscitation-promoting factor RpfA